MRNVEVRTPPEFAIPLDCLVSLIGLNVSKPASRRMAVTRIVRKGINRLLRKRDLRSSALVRDSSESPGRSLKTESVISANCSTTASSRCCRYTSWLLPFV